MCAFGRERKVKPSKSPQALAGRGERLGPHEGFTMKLALPTLIAVAALAGVASTAPAGTMEGHSIVSPQEIK